MNHIKSVLAKIRSGRYGMLIILIILLCVFSTTAGQDSPAGGKVKKTRKAQKDLNLFTNSDILNVTISLDLAAFLKKNSKNEAFDSDITLYLSPTDSVYTKALVRYRGLSRYNICTFPPMQINFRNPVYSDSFKIKKIKLVTHCQVASTNDEYVVREYLVYKLYSALTDTSFRVRLLHVKYLDSKNRKKPFLKYGIFIEPAEMLAKRTNSLVINTPYLNQSQIIPYVMDRLAIFNYMVTNWDWSIPGEHNVEVIKPMVIDTKGLGIAIPYDFDLTGVVNADYAIPPPDLGIENVRQPLFSGICRTREVYREDLRYFMASKARLYSVVDDFPHLNQRDRKDITHFLDQFFDKLDKERNLENVIDDFLYRCKK